MICQYIKLLSLSIHVFEFSWEIVLIPDHIKSFHSGITHGPGMQCGAGRFQPIVTGKRELSSCGIFHSMTDRTTGSSNLVMKALNFTLFHQKMQSQKFSWNILLASQCSHWYKAGKECLLHPPIPLHNPLDTLGPHPATFISVFIRTPHNNGCVRGIHCSKEVHDIDIDVRKQTTKETNRCTCDNFSKMVQSAVTQNSALM
jgi:hypothetical protein